MKWRKQMTNMWDDERVAKLVGQGGQEGLAAFGTYCRVLDIVAGYMDGKSDVCSVSYPVSRWAQLLVTRGSLVFSSLSRLAVTHLVTVERDGSDIRVTIPKLLKYRDEYSSKSGQTPHKEQNRTEQIKNIDSAPTVADLKLTLPPKPEKPKDPIAEWFEAEFWPNWIRHCDDMKGTGLTAVKAIAKTVSIREEMISAMAAQRERRLQQEPKLRVGVRRWVREGHWKESVAEPQPQITAGLFAPQNGNGNNHSNGKEPSIWGVPAPRYFKPED